MRINFTNLYALGNLAILNINGSKCLRRHKNTKQPQRGREIFPPILLSQLGGQQNLKPFRGESKAFHLAQGWIKLQDVIK